MKKIAIQLIKLYQIVLSPFFLTILGTKNACRFNPTCSEHAKQQVAKHGVFKGSYFSLQQFVRCQPFVK